MRKIVLPAFSSVKIIKIEQVFSRVMITNVLPHFYKTQCITLHFFVIVISRAIDYVMHSRSLSYDFAL